MNNEPLKENTLKTSFSAWKNDQAKVISPKSTEIHPSDVGS
ncbi:MULTISPECIES: hypothetical protein [Salegentibacter]|nr:MULTISPECIES: hypothetical protein [Salegentibacter]